MFAQKYLSTRGSILMHFLILKFALRRGRFRTWDLGVMLGIEYDSFCHVSRVDSSDLCGTFEGFVCCFGQLLGKGFFLIYLLWDLY